MKLRNSKDKMSGHESATRLPGSPNWRDAVSPDGQTWSSFRKTMVPRYIIVWRDICLCFLMIIIFLVMQVLTQRQWGPVVGLVTVPGFAFAVGFWLQALSTFGHEAAHYNLAKTHSVNDLLAEWFIWPWFAQTVRNYRKSHWQHHLHLGDRQDTEISYHNCLSPWFLLKTLTGVLLVQTLFRYTRNNVKLSHEGVSSKPSVDQVASEGTAFALVRTFVLNVFVVGMLTWFGMWTTAATWVVGVLVAFPCFAILRQALEHRRYDASCQEDFLQSEHGPVNRMFRDGPFARYFGAAGFRRHLLHHWDPSISYTCFDEMEDFLMKTPLADRLAAARSTYLATLVRLTQEAQN